MNMIRIMDYNNPRQPQGKVPDRAFARTRQAVRAVVTDEAGGVYLMHAANHGYYKLPGGGIDDGESREEALDREIREEMGARIRVLGEIGQTVQYDEVEDFRQDSFCYTARLVGELGQPKLTTDEAEAGFRVERFDNLDDAIAAVEQWEGPPHSSMTIRDAALLEAVRSL
jgi:8-oxo-dGTP diphosphatase